MLQFTTRRKILPTGEYVPDWGVRCELRNPGGIYVVGVQLKIDTQSDRTLIGLSFARSLQLDPDQLRRTSPRVRISGATGGHCIAYLHEVEFILEDDLGGWARWTATAAFAEPEPRNCLAGKVGFLQFLRFADNGPHFTLDPISGFPGQHQSAMPS